MSGMNKIGRSLAGVVGCFRQLFLLHLGLRTFSQAVVWPLQTELLS